MVHTPEWSVSCSVGVTSNQWTTMNRVHPGYNKVFVFHSYIIFLLFVYYIIFLKIRLERLIFKIVKFNMCGVTVRTHVEFGNGPPSVGITLLHPRLPLIVKYHDGICFPWNLAGAVTTKDPSQYTPIKQFPNSHSENKRVPRLFYLYHGPLTRNVKLRVAHAPGMPGTFSPPPTSKETAS